MKRKLSLFYIDGFSKTSFSDGLPVSGRNFDPQTRTLKKRNQGDEDGAQDSVEKDISGLAEQIIAEDEQARAQELDRVLLQINFDSSDFQFSPGSHQYSPQTS